MRRTGALLVLLVLLTACTGGPGDEPTSGPTGPATTAPTVEPTPDPDPPAAPSDAGVYYVLDTRAGLRLAREAADAGGEDAVRLAVEQMIAGPSDPDYSTSWDPSTTVLGVDIDEGTLTVDLSEDARTANIGSPGAALMIQQLVYTATDAAGDESLAVMLTIEGEPAGELWGAMMWDEPVTRADPLDVRLLVQIDDPQDGATVTSPVTVSGDAAVFEANLLWSVLDVAGAEVLTGFTTTAEGQTFAPYEFVLELEPGEYTVVISESDPSDGEGGTPMSDSKAVTVS
ncbi:Gmad2 immunoglobulin-like domain-containing protein [Cellulomonas sp. S1-8]|uniref:Gmad2 immunoglobulin-like domain-containing protein n=1 Tax=Cellulomonas sp. S1-8 TaxID=2904790 RepID=UPI00224450D2|nr:Gmad2 immunoglobulin-like domain-containing protein [Cellulomonas sp. S1-8]UZN03308.1 GerMN domain-containing protein [Cellulomonas sp. S1-8]